MAWQQIGVSIAGAATSDAALTTCLRHLIVVQQRDASTHAPDRISAAVHVESFSVDAGHVGTAMQHRMSGFASTPDNQHGRRSTTVCIFIFDGYLGCYSRP